MIQKHCWECGAALIEKSRSRAKASCPSAPSAANTAFPGQRGGQHDRRGRKHRPHPAHPAVRQTELYPRRRLYQPRRECRDAVRREILEETGLHAGRIHFNRTRFFEPSNTLMCNFTAFVPDAERIHVNREVDRFRWFSPVEARANIRPNSLAAAFWMRGWMKTTCKFDKIDIPPAFCC